MNVLEHCFLSSRLTWTTKAKGLLLTRRNTWGRTGREKCGRLGLRNQWRCKACSPYYRACCLEVLPENRGGSVEAHQEQEPACGQVNSHYFVNCLISRNEGSRPATRGGLPSYIHSLFPFLICLSSLALPCLLVAPVNPLPTLYLSSTSLLLCLFTKLSPNTLQSCLPEEAVDKKNLMRRRRKS